jgi:transcriptional regulator with PAS, ATPase and Fis domain
MKVTVGRSSDPGRVQSEKFASDLEQLKKESTDHIRRSFDSIVTIKDFLSENEGISQSDRYVKLVAKLESVEKKLSRFEDSLNERVARLIREYEKLKSDVETLGRDKKLFKALYDLSSLIVAEESDGVIYDAIAGSVADILSCDHALLQIVVDGKVAGQYAATSGNGGSKFAPSKQVTNAVINTGDPVMIESVMGSSIGCILCVPLKTDDEVTGLLHAMRYKGPFTKFEMEQLKTLSERIWQSLRPNPQAPACEDRNGISLQELKDKYDFSEIVTNSPEMAKVLGIVADVAQTESAVLIEGESGTGKELLARALHMNSNRKNEPFVAINCAAIPETLLESELFGYEKGAFTGAVGRKLGKFEQANGGTVFLDEIGDLPQFLQVKLLRFLQSHEFEPLGSTSVKIADVRIISATKKNLASMVEAGEFRDDLYYRINVIAIKLPALVGRTGEIEVLVEHFIKKYAQKNQKTISGIDRAATAYLKNYSYPGNVRELENIIERAVVLSKNERLSINELPESVVRRGSEKSEAPTNAREFNELKRKLWRETIGPIEMEFVLGLLERGDRNISEAARLGGLHRKQLQRMLKRYKLNAEISPDQKNGKNN